MVLLAVVSTAAVMPTQPESTCSAEGFEEESGMKSTDGVIRVGGVGTGRIFQHAHIRVYPKFLDEAWLVGFYDLDPERAEQARSKYATLLEEHAKEHPESAKQAKACLAELRCYESLKAMLEQVDAIDVATHAQGRMSTAIEALHVGVHAMVEKPMARTWTEADRAARVAEENPGVFLQLNDDNFYDPRYLMLRDLVADGAIGKPQGMSLIRGSRLDSTSVLKAQASAIQNGGGCLLDYGSHGLAGVWSILGTHLLAAKVEAVKIGVLFPHRVLEGEPVYMEVDDNARFKVLFEDPNTGSWVTLFIEASWIGGHIVFNPGNLPCQNGNMRIIGDKGQIESYQEPHITIRRWDGGETVVPVLEYAGESISFDTEMGIFFNCIRTGTRPQTDVHFGAEVMAVCGAAYLSAIQGTAITLDEFKDFSRGYVEKYGDNTAADDAIVMDLLAPYRRRD